MPPPTEWNAAADWYDQLVGEGGSEYHRRIILPGAMRLLQLQANDRFLDIACGQGVLCRLAHQHNARVLGLDASRRLIAAARRHGPQEIQYQLADARKIDYLAASHFHAAACILAIQNIHPIAPVFQGVWRALLEGGRFIIVMMHPCFRGPQETSWEWDGKNNIQFRRVDRYLLPRKTPIVTHPGKNDGQYTWSFHRPIEAYVKALSHAGFVVDALEEWPSHKSSQPGPRAAAENSARKEIPMFMAIRAIRPAARPAASSAPPEQNCTGGEAAPTPL